MSDGEGVASAKCGADDTQILTCSRPDSQTLTHVRYTTTHGPTMMKQLCLPGICLRIEECTQCGASSGLSETLSESMATRLAHVPQIFQVSVPAFPCFPVAPDHLRMSMNCAPLQCSKRANGMWVIDCSCLHFRATLRFYHTEYQRFSR